MFVSNISHQKSSISQQNLNEPVSEGRKHEVAKKSKKSNYQFIEIKEKTLRKLIIHLTKSEVTYESILDMIARYWSGDEPNGLT